MTILYLPLKAIYFDQIRDGTKKKEYRLATPYWRRRLLNRSYTGIELMKGYPGATENLRRLMRPWRGCALETIQHEHFGPEPVEVFAIVVNE
jgi:hypothetical protein